jgi:ABC-type phosphate/phosphonate transport system permease subunit
MLAWKLLLMVLGVGLYGSAAAVVAYDIYMATCLRWLLQRAPLRHNRRPARAGQAVATTRFGKAASAVPVKRTQGAGDPSRWIAATHGC